MTRPGRLRNDSVQLPPETYLREIKEMPRLNAEEEKQLAYCIENGDSEARDRMVRANLRLVVKIARCYIGRGLDLDDLIEEGNLGLLRAVEGFDPDRNTRFGIYASYWIKQSIGRALGGTARTIRIPAYMVELLAKWRRSSTKLQEELGRAPTQEEIARSLNLPKKKLNVIKKAFRIDKAQHIDPYPPPFGAFDWSEDDDIGDVPPRHPEGPGRTLDEMLMDDHTKTPDTEMVEADDLHLVLDLLDKMDKREATVLRMRFGLDGGEQKTLKEIGERFGLTRERVRQIESEALSKLSESMQAY
jgi:RNA polymerase primary sigma factor